MHSLLRKKYSLLQKIMGKSKISMQKRFQKFNFPKTEIIVVIDPGSMDTFFRNSHLEVLYGAPALRET